jgi:hypothetical protein
MRGTATHDDATLPQMKPASQRPTRTSDMNAKSTQALAAASAIRRREKAAHWELAKQQEWHHGPDA